MRAQAAVTTRYCSSSNHRGMSGAGELRVALLPERGHALGQVARGGGERLICALEVQCGGEVGREGEVGAGPHRDTVDSRDRRLVELPQLADEGLHTDPERLRRGAGVEAL